MSTQVQDVARLHRYEARVDGELAGFADYRDSAIPDGRRVRVFTHTEVADAYEGQGVGSALARQALDHVRSQEMAVLPLCPFIKGWIERHPDYRELVHVPPSSSVPD